MLDDLVYLETFEKLCIDMLLGHKICASKHIGCGVKTTEAVQWLKPKYYRAFTIPRLRAGSAHNL